MLVLASNSGIQKIALLKIGDGLDGLDWSDVKSLIVNFDKDFPDIALLLLNII